MKWLLSIPVWGERHWQTFERYVLPATLKALDYAGSEYAILVHTDDPGRVKALSMALPLRGVLCGLPLPAAPDRRHNLLGLCNRDVISKADRGEILGFINADMVPSAEVFAASERQFRQGKKLVVCAGIRTYGGEPTIGMSSGTLLDWALQNRHRVIEESFYGRGHSTVCSNVFFERSGTILLHAWHLHPFAAVVDRKLEFVGATTDCDFAENYLQPEIHIVTERAEMSFAELSPRDLPYIPIGRDIIDRAVVLHWADHNAKSPMHEWYFSHAIGIQGTLCDTGDVAICADILKERGWKARYRRRARFARNALFRKLLTGPWRIVGRPLQILRHKWREA